MLNLDGIEVIKLGNKRILRINGKIVKNVSINDIINLRQDKSFKYLFSKEEYILDFLRSYYDYIKDDKNINITINETHKHIMAELKKQKEFYGDVYVELGNGSFIGLEMYSNGFGTEEYVKSLAYSCRIFTNQFDIGGKFSDAKKVTLINFIKGNYSYENPYLVNRYADCHKETFKFVKNEYQEFIIVRVDLASTLEYNQSNKRFIKWCKFLNTSSFAELEKLVEGDGVMYNAYVDLKNYHDGFISMNEYQNYVYEMSRFKEQGKEEGSAEARIDVAIAMLDAGESIEKIQLYSGLPLEEIQKIEVK